MAGPQGPVLLLPGLKLVIPELTTGFGERLAIGDDGADLLLDGIDLFSGGQPRFFVRDRDDEHAVRVAPHQVAGMNARVADVDRTVHGFDLDPVLAGAHRVAAAEDRVAEFA